MAARPRHSAARRRQRGVGLPRPARGDRPRSRRRPDRRHRGGGGAGEIGRRLLAAADHEHKLAAQPDARLRRAAAIVALVGLPLAALAVYLPLGSPQLADFPLAARSRAPDAAQPLDNLVAQVEAHLEKNPTDGRGWSVLAPVLDAARPLRRCGPGAGAMRSPIAATVPNAAPISARPWRPPPAASSPAEAKAEFERAVAINADEVKASYFLGLAAEQDGRAADAASIWRAMLAKAPAGCAVASAGAGGAGRGSAVASGAGAVGRRRWPRPRT